MTPLETLTTLRKTFPTPMSNAQLGELLNAVAWQHRQEGFGLLAKPNGAHCQQPLTGKSIARDILASKGGSHFDVLVDAEGRAKPIWQDKGNYDPKRFVDPVSATAPVSHESDTGVPLSQPQGPTTPTPSFATQPYPDESTWWAEVFSGMVGLYEQADRAQDPMMFTWVTRIAYDIGSGMSKDEARAKHIGALRAALGL